MDAKVLGRPGAASFTVALGLALSLMVGIVPAHADVGAGMASDPAASGVAAWRFANAVTTGLVPTGEVEIIVDVQQPAASDAEGTWRPRFAKHMRYRYDCVPQRIALVDWSIQSARGGASLVIQSGHATAAVMLDRIEGSLGAQVLDRICVSTEAAAAPVVIPQSRIVDRRGS
ncbi:MAG: hypothetical protein KIT73_13575 [Burkholderiales bacterium]|nr:hypothetical protein [Burkholderiales bacterium]